MYLCTGFSKKKGNYDEGFDVLYVKKLSPLGWLN